MGENFVYVKKYDDKVRFDANQKMNKAVAKNDGKTVIGERVYTNVMLISNANANDPAFIVETYTISNCPEDYSQASPGYIDFPSRRILY